MPSLRITAPDFAQLERQLNRLVSNAINSALEDGRNELSEISPRGVSPFGESLAGSWEVEPIDLNTTGRRASIRNTADDAFRRLAGTPAGTFVDPRPGSPLFRWAQSKGLPARAVSRSIRSRGTERWRTGDNILDMDERGRLRTPDVGVPGRITREIQRNVDRVRL